MPRTTRRAGSPKMGPTRWQERKPIHSGQSSTICGVPSVDDRRGSIEPGSNSQILLYPLQFAPIYEYRLWGGRRLGDLLAAPLPGDGPIGEAWLLSDRG